MFARAVLIVEGDAENILLPTIAELLPSGLGAGCPLHLALVEFPEPTNDAFAKMVLVDFYSLFRRVDDRNFFP